MKKYYLIRHARPNFPMGESWCIGRTDLPLSAFGRMQACLLAEELHFAKVYSSPLMRAFETASFISDDIVTVSGLMELDAGEWDGLSFVQIAEQWPDLYNERGKNTEIPIPGGESRSDALQRFSKALEEVPDGAAVVAHNMVINMYMGKRGRMPYASYYSPDGVLHVPCPEMTPSLARKLRDAFGVPDNIKNHCDAVAEEAMRLSKGLGLDDNLIECACILHDIARLEKHHEQAGGEYLDALGYPQIGSIIRQHGELDELKLDESGIVFLADKYIRETGHVSINERFSISQHNCMSAEGMEKHNRRLKQALDLERMYYEKSVQTNE